ncbi:MAG: TolC family protein [Phycisphaeraceae bacterium]|nr:TolC family protein [Phycisphaeraceae bacterium]
MNRSHYLLILCACVCGLTACAPVSPPRDLEIGSQTVVKKETKAETAVLANSGPVEHIGSITLPQAISLVLARNRQLKAHAWGIRSADARQVQARLRPNPELDLSMEEFGGQGPRSGFDGVETTVAVTQSIETGGKRGKRSQVALLEKKLAQRDYELTRLSILKQTHQAFAEVWGVQQRHTLTRDQVHLAEQLLKTVHQRVEAGKDPPSEAAKAEIVLAQAQINVQQADRDLADARRRLALLWGASTAHFDRVDKPTDPNDNLLSPAQLQQQVKEHPQVQRCQNVLAIKRAQLALIKAEAKSNMSVTAGLKRLEQANDNTGVIGMAIPLPFFNRNQGAIAAAQYELAKAKEHHSLARAQLESQLAQSTQRLDTAQAHASMLKDTVLVNAETVFDAAEKRYKEGKSDYLELLDAQRTLFQTQAQLLQAQTSVRLARADLAFATGQFSQ